METQSQKRACRAESGPIRVRRMTIADHPAVFALWSDTPGVGLDTDCDSQAGIRRYLARNPGLSFVACDDGDIVGAVLSGHDGRRGYLHHLAVAEAYRRRGIARALVSRCLAALARVRIPKCNIFVMRRNRAGQAFWARIGWTARADLVFMQARTSGPAARAGRCG